MWVLKERRFFLLFWNSGLSKSLLQRLDQSFEFLFTLTQANPQLQIIQNKQTFNSRPVTISTIKKHCLFLLLLLLSSFFSLSSFFFVLHFFTSQIVEFLKVIDRYNAWLVPLRKYSNSFEFQFEGFHL